MQGGLFKAILNPDYSAVDFKKRSMSNAAQKASAFNYYDTPSQTPDKPSRNSNIFASAKPLRKSGSFANKENYGYNADNVDIFKPNRVLKEEQKAKDRRESKTKMMKSSKSGALQTTTILTAAQ